MTASPFVSITLSILAAVAGCDSKERPAAAGPSAPAVVLEHAITEIVPSGTEPPPPAVDLKSVAIGTQVWMAENLDVSHFRNGDPIPEVTTKADWEAAYRNEAPAWSYYRNDAAQGKKYGRLYNWYAVNDPRGLAPQGWHVATDKEWQQLIAAVGGQNAAFAKLKSASGFAALPGGERLYSDAAFYKSGEIGFWWTATRADKFNAWYHAMHFGLSQVGRDNGGMNTGFSVRCVRDAPDATHETTE